MANLENGCFPSLEQLAPPGANRPHKTIRLGATHGLRKTVSAVWRKWMKNQRRRQKSSQKRRSENGLPMV